MENTLKHFENKMAIRKLIAENKRDFKDFLIETKEILNTIRLEESTKLGGLDISKKLVCKIARNRIKTILPNLKTTDFNIYKLMFDCIEFNVTIDFSRDTQASIAKKIKAKKEKIVNSKVA